MQLSAVERQQLTTCWADGLILALRWRAGFYKKYLLVPRTSSWFTSLLIKEPCDKQKSLMLEWLPFPCGLGPVSLGTGLQVRFALTLLVVGLRWTLDEEWNHRAHNHTVKVRQETHACQRCYTKGENQQNGTRIKREWVMESLYHGQAKRKQIWIQGRKKQYHEYHERHEVGSTQDPSQAGKIFLHFLRSEF